MARVRTKAEQLRARRIRRALKLGRVVSRRDREWLVAYTRAVAKARVKPATSTERSRAARLRARLRAGDGLSRAESRFLDRYERRYDTVARAVARVEKARKPRSSREQDAERIAKRLAAWRGIDAPVKVKPAYGGIGVEAKVGSRRGATLAGYEYGSPPDLPKATGRLAAVRMRIDTPEGKRWVSMNALTDDWGNLEGELDASLDSIEDAYGATGIYGWSVYVRD